jgi:2-methylaconitate cis-trans-isomerase PrpF
MRSPHTERSQRSVKVHGQQRMIRCSIYRGGTSKGLYLLENDLPRDPATRDRVILALYGSPDRRQIDGLGGADPLTSKVAIISRSNRAGIDVEYTFGQVGIATACIDYNGNCGNILAGVGPFAVDEGLVNALEPVTPVCIFNTNTQKTIKAHVPVVDGKAAVIGDYAMPGVPGGGACIPLDFLDPAGAVTGELLPTGCAMNTLGIEGFGPVDVSLVDAGNPVVFVRARDVGMRGSEPPDEIEQNPALLRTLEKIRGTAADLICVPQGSAMKSDAVPKIIVVAPRQTYQTADSRIVRADEMDLLARALSMQHAHKAYPITGAICTAVAAGVEGTIPWEVTSGADLDRICIGHPMGVLQIEVIMERSDDGAYDVERATLARTSRRLMSGYAYLPSLVWIGQPVAD